MVGGEAAGRSIGIAWVATGMVMMNMIRSTSMTSINGVVFISIIGSPSSLPPLIDMVWYSCSFGYRARSTARIYQAFGSTGLEMKPTRG